MEWLVFVQKNLIDCMSSFEKNSINDLLGTSEINGRELNML